MLKSSSCLLVASHQFKKAQHPDASTKFGRNYNRSMTKYGLTGFGISTYSTKKNRSFVPRPLPTPNFDVANATHVSQATKSLSPQWRPFALKDGGVFFAHPSHKQVMTWSQDTLKKEAVATGTTTMDNWVNSRIQSIIADNTLENISLQHWRKKHLWMLVKKHGKIQRHFATPDYVKGLRSNMR